MRLTVPFLVSAGSALRRYTVLDTAFVEVLEVTASDAPMAATWTDLENGNDIGRRLRTHAGRFYTAELSIKSRQRPLWIDRIVRPAGGMRTPPGELIAYLEINGAFGRLNASGRDKLLDWYKPSKHTALNGYLSTTVENMDAREAALQAVEMAANGLLLVEGGLFFECGQPLLDVLPSGEIAIRSDFAMAFPNVRRSLGGDGAAARFSLDDLPRAREFADGLPTLRPERQRLFTDLRVFDPAAFGFDTVGAAATIVAYDLLSNHGPSIGSMTPGQIARFLDVREELDRALGGSADPVSIEEACIRFVESGALGGAAGYARAGLEKLGCLRHRLDEVNPRKSSSRQLNAL